MDTPQHGRLGVDQPAVMRSQRVALLGSVSKTLSPALCIGWLLAQPRWRRLLLASGARALGRPSSTDSPSPS
jgi:DNA-binding transcriptional MocR family regulator